VPDKEKRVAFLRAQKNVAEQNVTKGVPALSARPTGILRSPSRPKGGEAFTVLLKLSNFYLF
jgi:hypothetical protein